jgi:hypothetical protein
VENDSVVRRGHAPRFLRNLFCDCVNPLATIPSHKHWTRDWDKNT